MPKGECLHDVQPQLLEGRRVGELGQPLLAPGVEHPQLARLDQRREPGGVGGCHDVAAHDGLRQVGAALVGYVLQLDPQLLGDQLGGEVRAGQRAGGPVGEPARVGLGPADEIGPGLEGRIGGHDDAEGIARHVDDVGDVLDRVPVDLGRVGQAEHAQRNLRQRVAVGRRGLQLLRRQGAAGTGLVLDDDGLPQDLSRRCRPGAHGDVGRAAGREGNDELDRPGGERLRKRAERRRGNGGGCKLDELAAAHGVPSENRRPIETPDRPSHNQ